MYKSALQMLNVAYTTREITEACQKAVNDLLPYTLQRDDTCTSMTLPTGINEDAFLDKFLKELILLIVKDSALSKDNREYLITTVFALYEEQYS
jgi:hypothetical protein